jgi:tRNA nucleotidyltransferase (CCA-adding enzyme)
VGIPEKRFSEDALRILRGIRFASRYQLTPDAATEEAMLKLAPTMENLAAERVYSELCKLMLTATAADLLRYAPIITLVIPELQASVDFQQHSPHHAYDVFTHTAYVVENTPKELSLRLAALLHDVGKPATFTLDENGVGHFYDHASLSADMADAVLTRLKAPTALRQQVVLLIRQHMAPITPDEKLLRRRLAQYGEDTLRQLLALQKADRSAKGVAEADTDSDAALTLLEKVLAEQSCFSLKQLAVDGNDLIALGFAPGPGLGETLQKLLDMVVDQQIPNEKDALLKAAAAFKEETQ